MRVWIGLLLLLSLSAPACAQTADSAPPELPAALRGDYFRVQSAEIGRGFHIYVRYPEATTRRRRRSTPPSI